jgi:hypothetical protein
LNRRRQPFQSVAISYIQQLAGHGRLRKSFYVRASQTYLWVALWVVISGMHFAMKGLG